MNAILHVDRAVSLLKSNFFFVFKPLFCTGFCSQEKNSLLEKAVWCMNHLQYGNTNETNVTSIWFTYVHTEIK